MTADESGARGAQDARGLVVVEFDFLEAMGTLAALRAVIDSAPDGAVPVKLQGAADKIARASQYSEQRSNAAPTPGATAPSERKRRLT